MSTSAQAVYSTVSKPWLKRCASFSLRDQLVGDALAGRVMQRVPLQHLGLERPVLEDLRRQLDEVAQHLGAGQPLVGDLRQQPVQAVAELVEQRAHVVGRQQRRLAGRRPWRNCCC